MPEFFATLAACLQALADEWEIDVADIHEIRSLPNAMGDGWIMHVNDDRFAEIKPFRGKMDVRFAAFYSDFYYLFCPELDIEQPQP